MVTPKKHPSELLSLEECKARQRAGMARAMEFRRRTHERLGHVMLNAAKGSYGSRDRKLMPGVRSDSRWMHRCRAVIAAHLSDLGGVENAATAELSLARRAAVLAVECERIESWLAEVNLGRSDAVLELYVQLLDLYSRVSGNLRRILETLGVQRRPRDVSLTLSDYLQQPAVPLPEKPGFVDPPREAERPALTNGDAANRPAPPDLNEAAE
jgi:hypothetical protein